METTIGWYAPALVAMTGVWFWGLVWFFFPSWREELFGGLDLWVEDLYEHIWIGATVIGSVMGILNFVIDATWGLPPIFSVFLHMVQIVLLFGL
jgi:hypothetical protein